ncbi:hypothetical protein C8J55DRAFT_564088 [Lentinula edodes]|uniref:Uncharacterized protein n=1 Tax=Lentinula lateritia TaxID=40482 RepID=A0A9W9A063_9AGAR|nr:hypothetical protein C8J55DRAFT_564088 [Lentinula edodes]
MGRSSKVSSRDSQGQELTKHQVYYRKNADKRKREAREWYQKHRSATDSIASNSTSAQPTQAAMSNTPKVGDGQHSRPEDQTLDSSTMLTPGQGLSQDGNITPHTSDVHERARLSANPTRRIEVQDRIHRMLAQTHSPEYTHLYEEFATIWEHYHTWVHKYGGLRFWHKLDSEDPQGQQQYDMHLAAGEKMANDLTYFFLPQLPEKRSHFQLMYTEACIMLKHIGEGVTRMSLRPK